MSHKAESTVERWNIPDISVVVKGFENRFRKPIAAQGAPDVQGTRTVRRCMKAHYVLPIFSFIIVRLIDLYMMGDGHRSS